MSRFQMLDKLGEGSMGIVYEAYDRERDMHVALKTLRSLDASSLYRFKREFRAIADLSHPNIVSLYELISEGTEWFLTMELVRGNDLMSHLHAISRFADEDEPTRTGMIVRSRSAATNPEGVDFDADEPTEPPVDTAHASLRSVHDVVKLDRLRHTMGQLADGLHALHSAGLVHRDLKPENVRVTDEGRVVLMDFGVVAHIRATHVAANDTSIAGTPAYMAPELLDRVQPTAAADWYGFGTLLFEALTTRLPFSGSPGEVMAAKRERDAPKLQSLVLDLPEDLHELCERLLARDPSLRPTGADVLARLGVPHRPSTNTCAAADRAIAFVGREAELATLRAAYRASIDRTGSDGARGHCVVIDGVAGIGKSHLAEHFLDERGRDSERGAGLFVLASSCHERENLAYKALDGVIDDLSQLLRMLPDNQRDALIPRDIEFLERLFPVLARVPRAETQTQVISGMSPREQRIRAVVALRSLLEQMADSRPVIVWIESLQWADEDSLELLGELLQPGPLRGVLVLLTVRSGGNQPSVARTMARIGQHAGFTHLALGPLSSSEQRLLASRLTSYPALLGQLDDIQWRSMGGHPLLLIELARYLDEIGSAMDQPSLDKAPTLLQVIERHVARIPEDPQSMLEMLAVLGEPAPVRVLQEAASLSGEAAERAATTLLGSALVRVARVEHGLWLDCYHDKIREVVLARIPSERLRSLHRWLANILGQRSGVEPTSVARHLEAAGCVGDACDHLLAGARMAADKLALAQAAQLYRRVLALLSEPRDARSARLACRARISLAEGMRLTDDQDEALRHLGIAQSLAEHHELTQELSEIHYWRGNLLFPRGDFDGCRREHEQALEYARRALSRSSELRASSGLADVLYMRGHVLGARRHFSRCVELARELGLSELVPANLAMHAWTRFFCNQLHAGLDECRSAMEQAEAIGNAHTVLLVRCGILGQIQVEMGRIEAAHHVLEEGLAAARAVGSRRFEALALTGLGVVLAAAGRLEEAGAAAEQALCVEKESGIAFVGPWARSVLSCATRDPDVAREHLARGHELLQHSQFCHNHLYFHRNAMDVYLALGDGDAVLRHAALLEHYTAAEPLPWSRFFIERGRALVRFARHEIEPAEVRELGARAQGWGFVLAAAALEQA